MGKWKIYSPEGVQDILIDDCYIKRNLEKKIRELFYSRGYCEIETPTIEFYDVFNSESDMLPQETMFKFFDQQGRILVLRPDLTIPCARVTATKYSNKELPLRYSYISNTFKYNVHGGGRQKEYTQAGVEIMGVEVPEADAEVIATAVGSLLACGLKNFQIVIGQVDFFKGLMEDSGIPEQEIEQIRELIDSKDFLAIEELVKNRIDNKELKKLVLSLPGLFGSIDIIDRVEKLTVNKRALQALNNLRKILEILGDYGVDEYISIDLGMVQSLNYYTGTIFKGFTHGIGFPVLSGGRYDNVVEKFGKHCPATGFSLGLNLLMTALASQKVELPELRIDSIVCYENTGRKAAFMVAEALRGQGLKVEMDITGKNNDDIIKYARSRKIGGIIRCLNENEVEILNVENGHKNMTSINELLCMEG